MSVINDPSWLYNLPSWIQYLLATYKNSSRWYFTLYQKKNDIGGPIFSFLINLITTNNKMNTKLKLLIHQRAVKVSSEDGSDVSERVQRISSLLNSHWAFIILKQWYCFKKYMNELFDKGKKCYSTVLDWPLTSDSGGYQIISAKFEHIKQWKEIFLNARISLILRWAGGIGAWIKLQS